MRFRFQRLWKPWYCGKLRTSTANAVTVQFQRLQKPWYCSRNCDCKPQFKTLYRRIYFSSSILRWRKYVCDIFSPVQTKKHWKQHNKRMSSLPISPINFSEVHFTCRNQSQNLKVMLWIKTEHATNTNLRKPWKYICNHFTLIQISNNYQWHYSLSIEAYVSCLII